MDAALPGDRLDPLLVLAGLLVAVAGVLVLAQPYVGTVPVGGAAVPAFVLGSGVLGLAFAVGGLAFLRRGDRRVAAVHLVAAGAWAALFVAASVGSPLLVAVGGVLILAGASVAVADRLGNRA